MTTDDIKGMHLNKLVSWFMISSYAYYHLHTNVMSDYDYDFLVRRIIDNWDSIDHPHKSLIEKTNLDSGSGYDIKFPTIVKAATVDFLNKK